MISIIIPTIGRPTLLGAVDSALAVSRIFGGEVVVVDDAPSELYDLDEGVRVVRSGMGNVAQARNLGIKNSGHEWVIFLDDDDCLLAPLFASAEQELRELFSSHDMVVWSSAYEGETSLTWPASKFVNFDSITILNCLPVGGYALRKDVINSQFDDCLGSHEDYEFLLANTRALASDRIARVDRLLVAISRTQDSRGLGSISKWSDDLDLIYDRHPVEDKHVIEGRKSVLRELRRKQVPVQRITVISTYFNGKPCPQSGITWEADNFDVISEWYNSILAAGYSAIVIHDCLSVEFVERYSNERVTFIKIDGKVNRSVNDYRFYEYLKLLPKISSEFVFFTDISDVSVFNPLVDDQLCHGELYLGKDQWDIPQVKDSGWMREKIVSFKGAPEVANYIRKQEFLSSELLNAGIIGGDRHTVSKFLSEVCQILNKCAPEINSNMLAVNIIACEWLRHKLRINSSDVFFSKFKAFEDNGNFLFRHK